MVSRDEMLGQARRRYLDFLGSIVEGRAFFPLDLRIGKTHRAETYSERLAELDAFRRAAKELCLMVEWRTVNDPRFGQHERPERAFFSDESAYLNALGAAHEVAAFREDVALIRDDASVKWIRENVRAVVDHHGNWPKLLRVVRWFRANPRSGLYLRQIPVEGVDTKFMERHLKILESFLSQTDDSPASAGSFEERHGLRREDPTIRFRFLDRSLQAAHGFPVDDLAVPLSAFSVLPFSQPNVIVTENVRNFLALPDIPKAIGIFGGGNAISLLSGTDWLRQANLFYWGDIDAHGFAILSRVREAYPQTCSLMMDAKTLEVAGDLVGPGIPTDSTPLHLTPEEKSLFQTVVKENSRLEQERIPYGYAVLCLLSAMACK